MEETVADLKRRTSLPILAAAATELRLYRRAPSHQVRVPLKTRQGELRTCLVCAAARRIA